jgi:hypothetical protein
MLRIFYCDDESNFRSSFAEKHGPPNFEVTVTNDIYGVPAMLNGMEMLPDLVVLDLYHTKASPDSSEAKSANKEVEEGLLAVKKVLDSLRVVVNRSKDPAAIKILEEIRSYDKLKELPVLLYTREGLSLLSDEELHKSIQLGADWMLKGRSKEFESGKMYSVIQQHRLSKDTIEQTREVKKLTVSQLMRELTPTDIWKIIVAQFGAFAAVASFAYWLGQKLS